MPRILVFAGSNRRDSLNRRLAAEAARAIEALGARATLIELSDHPLPLYSGDLEATSGLPPAARSLKRIFEAHDALAIASPENNSSVSALLRNTLDWVSRPDGGSSDGLAPYRNKTALLLAASPRELGGLHGLGHLRDCLEGLGVMVLPQTFALGQADRHFDDEGRLEEPWASTLLTLCGKLVRLSSALREGPAP